MSLPVPLAVRLVTATADMHVTRDLRDLSFRSEIPGGFATCQMDLDRPLFLNPAEIAIYGKVYVYDARNGRTVWEGRLEDPGRSAGSDGSVYRLSAVGPSAYARDVTLPLIYVDSSLERWTQPASATPTGSAGPAASDTTPSLSVGVGNGATATTSFFADWVYTQLWATGQKLARVKATVVSGKTVGVNDWTINLYTSGTSAAQVLMSTAAQTLAAKVGDANFNNGDTKATLRLNRNNSNIAVADDATWTRYYNIAVRTMLKDALGADITTGYTANTVLSNEVVADLLGRLLGQYDGAGADISGAGVAIDQLAYPDGTTAADVLNDVMGLQPNYYWAAWESNPSGLHRFEWRPWPAFQTYCADSSASFDAQGSADGLYNAVWVRWRDVNGQTQTLLRVNTVPALDAAGITRTGSIDLGDNTGSAAAAAAAGDAWLAQHAVLTAGGTIDIGTAVKSLYGNGDRNGYMQPWELRPGNIIALPIVLPTLASLATTGPDALSLFAITATEYQASSNTVTCELDGFDSVSGSIMRLHRTSRLRRR